MDLKGSQKIAVLLLALGDKFTADVFKRLDRQEITAISKAIVDLPPVPREEVESVLREFHQSLVTGMDVVSGGEDAAKRLLISNLDGEPAKNDLDSLQLETGPVPFRELELVSPRMLPQLLRSEVAVNVGEGNYDAVLVSEFRDLEALEAYKNDPRHKAVSALCKSIRMDRVAVDYEF